MAPSSLTDQRETMTATGSSLWRDSLSGQPLIRLILPEGLTGLSPIFTTSLMSGRITPTTGILTTSLSLRIRESLSHGTTTSLVRVGQISHDRLLLSNLAPHMIRIS